MSSPDSVSAALTHWLRSGDVVLHLPGFPDELSDSLVKAGFHPVFVDLSGVENKADLMAALGESLGLDTWFGANWDALNDALYGPDDPQARPMVLLLRQPEGSLRLPKEDYRTLLEVITDVANSDRSTLRGAIILVSESGTSAPAS